MFKIDKVSGFWTCPDNNSIKLIIWKLYKNIENWDGQHTSNKEAIQLTKSKRTQIK